MNEIIKEQIKAEQAYRSYAVATAVAVKGASPCKPGRKMLIYPDGTIAGTIGGGLLEKLVIEDAKKVIHTQKLLFREYDLTTEDGAASCNPIVKVVIEPFCARPQLVVVGAGHVGGAVLRCAKLLNFETTLIDNRPAAQIQARIDEADRFISCETYDEGVKNANIPSGAFYFCSTWSHENDAVALRACLEQDAPAYIGMTGSKPKIKTIFGQLKEAGFSDEMLDSVHTPVGLDICGSSPEEIGFAIMAEILMVKNGGTGKPCKEL